MPRLTRKSIRENSEVKENIEVETKITPKKKKLVKRKIPSIIISSDEEESESSPPKSSRSNSLSPFRNQFSAQLNVTTPKSNNFRSARRALVDNSEFKLPGREKEVRKYEIK